MTPQQFKEAVNRLNESILIQMPEINERAALNASSLVKNRIINSGVNGDDKYLGEYEDTPYKKFRAKTGRQIEFVDLNYTGQMFRDIGVMKQITNGAVVKTVVGPKDTKNRKGGVKTSDIAEGNAERYGNFLKPNQEEISLIGKQLTSDINKLIKAAFT